jgi:hypothetical protein
MKRKKPIIKGKSNKIDNGLKSGRRKFKASKKEKEEKNKDNPLLSQPPTNSSVFKWFINQNELHKKAAPKQKKNNVKFEELDDDQFFKQTGGRFLDRNKR